MLREFSENLARFDDIVKEFNRLAKEKKKKVIRTWARQSVVTPEFVGLTFAIHNGKQFIPVFISENMVGHRLGEFAPTRTFRVHSGDRKREKHGI